MISGFNHYDINLLDAVPTAASDTQVRFNLNSKMSADLASLTANRKALYGSIKVTVEGADMVDFTGVMLRTNPGGFAQYTVTIGTTLLVLEDLGDGTWSLVITIG